MAVNNSCNEVPTLASTANQVTATLSGTQYTLSLPVAVTTSTQPLFHASLINNVSGATGDATVYTVLFDNVLFDQNSNYTAGSGTFTAPVTGKYIFSVGCEYNNGGTESVNVLNLVTTGRTYQLASTATYRYDGGRYSKFHDPGSRIGK